MNMVGAPLAVLELAAALLAMAAPFSSGVWTVFSQLSLVLADMSQLPRGRHSQVPAPQRREDE